METFSKISQPRDARVKYFNLGCRQSPRRGNKYKEIKTLNRRDLVVKLKTRCAYLKSSK